MSVPMAFYIEIGFIYLKSHDVESVFSSHSLSILSLWFYVYAKSILKL